MIDPLSSEKNAHNRQNFLSLIDRVIFQKWHTEITLVINKEFSLTEIALIDSGADINCIQEGLIPLKYYEKSSERLTQANGEKFIINYKIPNVHICNDGTMLSQYEWTNSLIDVPNKIIINNTRYDHLGNQTDKNLGRIWPSYPQGKPESIILKESKFIQTDLQAPMLDFLMLPTSRTYWHDHVQAPNPRTPSFLDSPPNTSTPACVFFKFQWQQLNWSSRHR